MKMQYVTNLSQYCTFMEFNWLKANLYDRNIPEIPAVPRTVAQIHESV